MNKSQRDTYKKLSQNRASIRRIMKLPNNEGKFPRNENELPKINIKNSTLKIHDRDVKGDSFPNPFDIPAQNRLFTKKKISRKVKPISFIMSEPETICDLDKDFYKIIEGRPIRRFDDIKVYIRNLRNIVLIKADATFLQDKMLMMDALNEYELKKYNKIVSLYTATRRNFAIFAKSSYNIAKELESMAELKAIEIAKISDELEDYCFEYIRLKNQVLTIIYKFEVLVTYGKFLHTISPDSWRIEFDNLNSKIDSTDDISVHQDSQFQLLMSMASLDELKSKATVYSSLQTRIYFREPQELIQLFENLSEQCRNYMCINIISTKLVKSCIKSCDNLKIVIKKEEDLIQDEILFMKTELAYMERRELEYKSAFESLIQNSFYQLFAGHENVKLFNCVQFATSKLYGDFDDPNDSVSVLMRRIEQEYMDVSLAMDYLDVSTVKKVTKQMFADDEKVMKRAHCAQRTMKECDILKKCLNACFEPPRPRKMIVARQAKNGTDTQNITKKVIEEKLEDKSHL